MVFNSIEFAIFLPIVFFLYWFVFNRNLKLQNLFVVAVSYLFYGWWDWRFLFLIALTSICSWGSGILIDKYRHSGNAAKWISAVNIALNLLILGIFKYYNFFVRSFSDLFLGGCSDGLFLNVVLPVGISFYTFQALSYSIDVYRQKIEPTRDVVEFFAFVSFFPQLVAGPIERATNLLPQFQHTRMFDYAQASDGMRQILWGLFKKIVVADNCAIYADMIFGDSGAYSGSQLLVGAVMFAFQIYGDFSGYSDIAIGTSKLFGINLMRNFNVPYFSRDIAEFWRRWHISLTTWFRDYIYIPLGGSRCSSGKIIRNTFVIFLVSGLWHGANWTFIMWGAYHALLFRPLILLHKNRKYRGVIAEDRILPNPREIVMMICTFLLVALGWIIFRSETIGQAFEFMQGMWQWNTLSAPYAFFFSPDTRGKSFFVVLMLIVEWFNRRNDHGLGMLNNCSWYIRYPVYLIIVVFIVWYCGQNQSFIYFQF